MNDNSDVRFVYTHAEGVCSDHDAALVGFPTVLFLVFVFGGEPSMVEVGRNAVFLQYVGNLTCAFARSHIDDSTTRCGI